MSKSIGLVLLLEVNLPFLLCFTLHLRAILLGGLYFEGRFNGGFMRHRIGGLIFGGACFRNFTAS